MSGRCQYGAKKISKTVYPTVQIAKSIPIAEVQPSDSAQPGVQATQGWVQFFVKRSRTPGLGGGVRRHLPTWETGSSWDRCRGSGERPKGLPSWARAMVRSPNFAHLGAAAGPRGRIPSKGRFRGHLHIFTQCEKQNHEKKGLRPRIWSSKTHRCPMTDPRNQRQKNTAFPPKHARGNQVHTSTRTPHPVTHTASPS